MPVPVFMPLCICLCVLCACLSIPAAAAKARRFYYLYIDLHNKTDAHSRLGDADDDRDTHRAIANSRYITAVHAGFPHIYTLAFIAYAISQTKYAKVN